MKCSGSMKNKIFHIFVAARVWESPNAGLWTGPVVPVPANVRLNGTTTNRRIYLEDSLSSSAMRQPL